jgi:hypothetical protein
MMELPRHVVQLTTLPLSIKSVPILYFIENSTGDVYVQFSAIRDILNKSFPGKQIFNKPLNFRSTFGPTLTEVYLQSKDVEFVGLKKIYAVLNDLYLMREVCDADRAIDFLQKFQLKPAAGNQLTSLDVTCGLDASSESPIVRKQSTSLGFAFSGGGDGGGFRSSNSGSDD